MSKETEPKTEDRGCLTAMTIIWGSFVGAGVIFLVGRTLFGEDGSYIFFYTLLGLGVASVVGKLVWDRRKGGQP